MATKIELEKENTELKTSLEQMQKQFDQMQKMLNNLANAQPQTQPQVQPQQNLSSKKIRVISLIPNMLVLTTEPDGGGRVFYFDKFGAEKRIKFDDLDNIVQTHYWIFEQGLAYICDKEAVAELGLQEEYENIIDKKGIVEIAKLQSKEDVEMLCTMNETMQEKVIDMIAEDVAQGNTRDMANLFEIQNRLGIDVIGKAKELKEIKK